ncbi:EamA family transporter [Vagococcus elongatus]|uniref:EamA family transporter n=1 Tax=Vagococcus elongatus TaxID=180344 RepID=A0A430AMI8_9ENTE|nr:DMT family transporter [Vagococcus elongatus]RSU09370.1 EamA family transporter [Vagococcus elongatus]
MKGYIYVIIGACSYGVLSTFVKLAYTKGFIVNDVVGIQMFIGAILLWGSVLYQRFSHTSKQSSENFKKINKKNAWKLLIIGSSTGLTGMLYYLALQYISASLAIVLLFQFTWIGILIEAIITRKIPQKITLLSLIPLLFGTLLAAGVLGGNITLHPLGLLFGFSAAISYSIFVYASGQIAPESNPLLKTAIMITGGFILCSVFLPPNFFSDIHLFIQVTLHAGIYLGFFGPFLSTLMFAKGTPLIGTGMASLLGAMELPTAIFMSQIVLKETVGLGQYIGILLIISAIFLPHFVNRTKKYTYTNGGN